MLKIQLFAGSHQDGGVTIVSTGYQLPLEQSTGSLLLDGLVQRRVSTNILDRLEG